jgi:hypothetical protein
MNVGKAHQQQNIFFLQLDPVNPYRLFLFFYITLIIF